MEYPRLVVMGTAAFTVPSLERLHGLGYPIQAVYTQPPRPAGRGHKPQRSPVHEAALRLGLDVHTPVSLRDPSVQEAFRGLSADLVVVGAYGLLLPLPVLAAPRLGCINLHASLLPRWRGAAPIERAILAGDPVTGISIFRMEEGLDTGPVYAMRPVQIGAGVTAADLHEALGGLTAEMLPEIVDGITSGTMTPAAQPDTGVTYAPKLRRAEGLLDFSEPAGMIERRLRALNPRPGCHTAFGGERLLLLRGELVDERGTPGTVIRLPLTIACGEDALRVTQVQRAGRRPMPPEELQRGFPIPLGSLLEGGS
jgi:methionyl-tRNA formyltransferase